MFLQQALFDNPILIKHVRSRLRRSQLFPAVAGVVLLCGFLVWIAYETRALFSSGGVLWLLLVQGILLFSAGTAQVATVMAHAKDSGIIDFHRISPVRPWALVVGFVLGGAIREWLLFACTLPVALACIAAGGVSAGGYLLILCDIVLVTLLYHSMAVLAGLVSPKPRNVSGGVVALVFMMYTMGSMVAQAVPAIPTIIPTVADALDWGRGPSGLGDATFFGAALPRFVLSLMHQVPLLVFLFIAAERKMRSDRAFLYSKPVALLFFAVIAVLLLGDVAGIDAEPLGGSPALPSMIVTYGLTFAGVLLSTAVTPPAGDFANGVLRAKKQGLRRAPVWSDLSANWAPTAGFCAILTLGSLAAALLTGLNWSGPVIASTFVGACAVYYFASARQAFELMFRKNGSSYLTLMLFVIWLLPLLIGGLAAASRLDQSFYQTVLGLSPLAGIFLTAAGGEAGALTGAGGMAVSSSLLFVIAFTQLRLQAERRAADAALKVRE